MKINEIFNLPRERIAPASFNKQTISSDCHINHNKAKIYISIEWIDITDYEWARENAQLHLFGMRKKMQGLKEIKIICETEFDDGQNVIIDIPDFEIFYGKIYGLCPEYLCVPNN
ncbi:MAG: hypothetical protein ACLFVR_14990 [Thiohalospira sp.]